MEMEIGIVTLAYDILPVLNKQSLIQKRNIEVKSMHVF